MLSQKNKQNWRNPWFVGLIGVVVTAVLVNSVLIWKAYHSSSTLVDHEYSTKDRKSDTETIDDIQAQNTLAWKVTLKLPKKIVLAIPSSFEIDVKDRDGIPVSGKMEVVAYRSADAEKDFSVPFTETSSGKFQGYISFPLKGIWELRIRVKRANDVFEVGSNKFSVAQEQ
jgi:nitrogen fixation protein FixH